MTRAKEKLIIIANGCNKVSNISEFIFDFEFKDYKNDGFIEKDIMKAKSSYMHIGNGKLYMEREQAKEEKVINNINSSLERNCSLNLTVEDKANTYDNNIIKSDVKKSNNIDNNHDGKILSNDNYENSSKSKRINNPKSVQYKDENNKKEIVNSNVDKVDTFIKPLLNKHKIKFIDNRLKKGAFWVLGGLELNNIMKKFGQYGFIFTFKKQGGRASKNMPAWYLSKY